jgi:hypothetical protein
MTNSSAEREEAERQAPYYLCLGSRCYAINCLQRGRESGPRIFKTNTST